jgi:hypothetical protein
LTWNFKPALLYLEEAAEIIGKNDSLPISHPIVYKCLQQGGARKVSVLFSTQMLSQANLAFFRQFSDLFIFFLSNAECRILENMLGIDENQIKFENPKDYTFYHFQHPNTLTRYDKIDIRISKEEQSEFDSILEIESENED